MEPMSSKGAYPKTAARLAQIQEHLVDEGLVETRDDCADYFGFSYSRWSNYLEGFSLPIDAGIRIVKAVPGLALGFVYLGRSDGMPLDMCIKFGLAERHGTGSSSNNGDVLTISRKRSKTR